jgi:hypothetical protein
LDGGSAHSKAHTEQTHTDIHAQVGFVATNTIYDRAAIVIGIVYDIREINPSKALDKIEFVLCKYGSKQELTVQFSFPYEI